jgi:hypothetical protein
LIGFYKNDKSLKLIKKPFFLGWTILIRWMLLLSVIVFNTCTTSKDAKSNLTGEDNNSDEIYAIENVTIIPMTEENKLIENATILIGNKKIISINGTIPINAKIIDGKNKWLIPGLIDMHVHNLADGSFTSNYPTKGATLYINTQDIMLLYVANGVTTAFELSARVEHFAQRNEIKKGNAIGPRLALALLIDGGNGSGNIANTPEDGRQTVRIAKAQGYEFIKVYGHLNIETFKAIVDESNKQGLKVVGHIPIAFEGRIEEAFVPHFDMVAHAEEFARMSPEFSNKDISSFAKLAKNNGTWLIPTLTTIKWIASQTGSLDSLRNLPSLKYVHPLMQSKWLYSNAYNQEGSKERVAYFEKMVDFNNRLVKAFKYSGVPIVTGTDAGTSGVVWGFSLHDELELLVKAGLSTNEALEAGTRLPSIWLEIPDQIGTVEVGKYADLVLLDANPLQNIKNTRKIAGVFVNGKWLNKKKIDSMLSDLAKKNNAIKDRYDWKKRKEY